MLEIFFWISRNNKPILSYTDTRYKFPEFSDTENRKMLTRKVENKYNSKYHNWQVWVAQK